MLNDDVWDTVGGWGRYQKVVCLLLAVGAIPTGYFTMSPVFANKTPEHRCRIPDIDGSACNYTEPKFHSPLLYKYIPWDSAHNRYHRCKRFNTSSLMGNTTFEACKDGYVYDKHVGEQTAVTEWDLVCDQSSVKPFVTSVYMAGVLFGSLLLGAVGDRFGRRPVTIGALYLQFVFKSLNLINSSPGMYAALMFLSGTSSLVYFVAAVVLAEELVDTDRRALVETMIMLAYSFGYVLLPLAAYNILSWKWLISISGLCGVLFIPYWWLIPESLRWLITARRYERARKIMKNIARKNKKAADIDCTFTDEKLQLMADDNTKQEASTSTKRSKKLSIPYVDLFIKKGILIRTLLSSFSWFTVSLIYVTLSLNTGNLGGNEYINCLISAALEIPAYCSVYLILRNKGRRTIIVSYFGISSLSCIVTPLANRVSTIGAIVCAMTGKFFVTSIFSLIYLFTAELFPTEGRNQAVGLCSTCARAGAIIAPYIIYQVAQTGRDIPYVSEKLCKERQGVSKVMLDLETQRDARLDNLRATSDCYGENGSSDFPYYVIGGLAIVACIANMFLPETRGRALPDTYEDAAALKSSFMPCRPSTKKQVDIELHFEQQEKHN